MAESSPYERGIRLGFFGNFSPSRSRLGPHSTGLVMALSCSERIRSIRLFTTTGAEFPPSGLLREKVTFERCWTHDSPLALLRALLRMLRARPQLDVIVFNMFPTAFGRSKLANAIGMCLPIAVSVMGRVPVVVYMHNAVQTEDFASLGYHPPKFVLWGLDRLTRRLARTTTLVMPLPSQSTTLNARLGVSSRSLFLPYVEALPLLAAKGGQTLGASTVSDERSISRPVRLLFFGSWGPQKDLKAIARILSHLNENGITYQPRFGGSINPTFPSTEQELVEMITRAGIGSSALTLNVPDESVGTLLLNSHVLLLPYRAAGGPSGVMNTAALFDLPAISYDHPELRETASLTGLRAVFVRPDDDDAVLKAISDGGFWSPAARRVGAHEVEERVSRLQGAVDHLIDLFQELRRVGPEIVSN